MTETVAAKGNMHKTTAIMVSSNMHHSLDCCHYILQVFWRFAEHLRLLHFHLQCNAQLSGPMPWRMATHVLSCSSAEMQAPGSLYLYASLLQLGVIVGLSSCRSLAENAWRGRRTGGAIVSSRGDWLHGADMSRLGLYSWQSL